MKQTLIFCLFFVATLYSFSNLQAGKLESLVMPGKVIEGHADLEKDCDNCHSPFKKRTQSRLCLDCHDKIAADINKHKGFHGRIKGLSRGRLKKAGLRECKTCHTEHKGRDADVVNLDKDTFDHRMTDFRLRGRHKTIDCGACHKPDKKFREAPSDCFSCHEEDDIHHQELGKKCDDCHNEIAWTKEKFDHNLTDFPLEGAHRKTACNNCHPDERYKNTPTDCYSCHQSVDPHKRIYGKKCDKCHASADWEKTHFNHNKDTNFPHHGKHRKLPCQACHSTKVKPSDMDKRCIACHKKNDIHHGQYGKKCDKCHTDRGWKKLTFKHDKDTDFPLRGKHKKVFCEDCHKGQVYEEELKTTCYSCHEHDDVHKGQEGKKCEQCHNEEGWKSKVLFDHDLTRFPLLGLHSIVPCEECHLDAKYQDTERACFACHEDDDTHKLTQGKHCEHCHNPNGWSAWIFDHDKQTDYVLDGAHKKVKCEGCHRKEVENDKDISLTGTCYECHQMDDIHHGSYGTSCERCHVTSSFREIKSPIIRQNNGNTNNK